ncbi:hypothetical protein ACIRPQ_07715 [Streptomyces sp. NPDC101213]|uniref:hypothetical protein n=1 Tax=Streptomyces sp. NPDC101213 TaxID=3366130 RepID=UPI00381B3E81
MVDRCYRQERGPALPETVIGEPFFLHPGADVIRAPLTTTDDVRKGRARPSR